MVSIDNYQWNPFIVITKYVSMQEKYLHEEIFQYELDKNPVFMIIPK